MTDEPSADAIEELDEDLIREARALLSELREKDNLERTGKALIIETQYSYLASLESGGSWTACWVGPPADYKPGTAPVIGAAELVCGQVCQRLLVLMRRMAVPPSRRHCADRASPV